MFVIDRAFYQQEQEKSLKLIEQLKIKKDLSSPNTTKDTLLPYTDFNYLIKSIIEKNMGKILIQETDTDYFYAILLDVGLFYLKMKLGEIYKLFSKVDKKIVHQFYKSNDRNVNRICPTTFFFFTNIKAENWFQPDSLINATLEAYPCYNAMQLSSIHLNEEAIEEDNETRSFILYSSMKAKKLKEKELKKGQSLEDSKKDLKENDQRLFMDFTTQKAQQENNEDVENSDGKHSISEIEQDDNIFYFNKLVKKEGIKDFCVYEIQRFPELVEVYDDNRNETTSIIMPVTAKFKELEGLKKEKIILTGFEMQDEHSMYFTSKIGSQVEAYCYDGIKFNEFYNLEAKLDLFHVFEGVRIHNQHQNIFFWAQETNPKYVNDIVRRENNYEIGEIYEDKMVADIYTVIPFRYENREILKEKQCLENNFIVNNLITGLRFQENYEFGNENHNVRKYQDRIKRYDLGTVSAIICEDRHYNYYYKSPTELIEKTPIPLRLIIACDKDTHTAVLYLLNFSVKSYPTGYLDEVCRNDILIEVEPGYEYLEKGVIEGENGPIHYMSLYTYLKDKYKIFKSGLPRHLVISPYLDDENENCMGLPEEIQQKIHEKYMQIKSSIMYAETVFEDEEELGKVIDPEIKELLKVPYGISIYDYAKSYISRQVLLLYADTFKDYLAERIDFAVVDLFYVELICLEDAAIQISNYSISKFINNYKENDEDGKKGKFINPQSVLEDLDAIEEEYAKTLDLWDVQMNYSSSKIFLAKMREAFEIEQSIKRLKRTKEEIAKIYQSKNAKLTGHFATIISFVTIILTVIQIFQIYLDDFASAEKGENETFFSFFEKIVLQNLTMVELLRLGLCIWLLILALKFLFKRYMSKIISKIKNK